MITLRQLRYFVVLAEELHFGRAAERLGISQPPLSQQIRALELFLKADLFERTNRRVELTPAGRALLREAKSAIEQTEHAIAVVGQASRGEVGELKIGFTPSAPVIAPFTATIREFKRTVPGVRLVLEEMVTVQQVDALIERRLHVGFIRGPHVQNLPDMIAATEILREPLALFLQSDHPLAKGGNPVPVKALAAEPFVFYTRDIGTSLLEQVTTLCRKAGFRPRFEQEARANATILGLVAAGLGVSILPLSLKAIGIPKVACRPLAPAGPPTSMWLVHRRDDHSAATSRFVAMAAGNSLTVPKVR